MEIIGTIAGTAIVVLIIIAIIIMVLYNKNTAFKTAVDALFTSSSIGFNSSSDSSSKVLPASSTTTDELNDGVNDAWYSTVTSDNNKYMSDYQGVLDGSVITDSMASQHSAWSAEVGPKSRTTIMLGDMEEAATMAMPRTGLSAYRFRSPPTYGNPSQYAEGDDYRHQYGSRSYKEFT
jgi:hypothetical protein